jgi:hypothetical protein
LAVAAIGALGLELGDVVIVSCFKLGNVVVVTINFVDLLSWS